jgi:signal peptidase I
VVRRLSVRVYSSWLNRIRTLTKRSPARAHNRRRNNIKTPRFAMSGFSKPWRWLAARSRTPIFSAGSTGILRSLLSSMPYAQPCTPESREDLKLDLATELLRSLGTVTMKTWGTSMLPALWPEDLLTIQSAAHDEVASGDIVLVLRDNRFFVHRLIEKRKVGDRCAWITRGDAMPQDDPPAAEFELLGRVTGIRRGNRAFVPSRQVSLPNSALAWTLCRWDRARGLALRMHAARMQACATHP